MSVRVFYDILNQKGTPAMYTDTFANRPAYGYQGRLFISTDSGQIFEDTGSAWTLVADAGVGGGTLSSVCLNGNTTATGIVITAGGLSSNSITNTGITAGSIIYAGTGGLMSQSNSTFFWDSTNNRLGIGNASPGAPLDIHGTGTQIQVNGTGASNSYIQFQNAGVNKWRIGNTYSAGANTFDLYNNSLTSTALSFNVTTNAATFNNSITATSLIKSGGTSTQFLKADGSIDSSTYITLSSISGTSPINYNSGTGAISITQSSGSVNGYLSSTDWTTFNNKQNTITNPITGTGASGQVAYWSGTATETGSNNLFWDNTNTRLGINTTTPSAGVTSSSTTASTQFKAVGTAPGITFSDGVTSVTYGGAIGSATTTNNYITGSVAGDLCITNQSPTPTGILFGLGTTEKMRLSSAGNFGIGTSNPTDLLVLNKTSASTVLQFQNGGTSKALMGISYAASDLINNSAAGDLNIRSNNTNINFSIDNGSTLGMRVTSGGSLIVGATSALNYTGLGRLNSQASGTGESALIIANNNTGQTNTTLIIGAGRYTSLSSFNFINCLSGNSGGDQFVTEQFKVRGDGVIYAQNTSVQAITSDRELKTDIKDYDKGIAEILAMKPRYFKYKDNLDEEKCGFIAQEMEDAIEGSMVDSSMEGYKTYQVDWYPLLVKAIQELNEKLVRNNIN